MTLSELAHLFLTNDDGEYTHGLQLLAEAEALAARRVAATGLLFTSERDADTHMADCEARTWAAEPHVRAAAEAIKSLSIRLEGLPSPLGGTHPQHLGDAAFDVRLAVASRAHYLGLAIGWQVQHRVAVGAADCAMPRRATTRRA